MFAYDSTSKNRLGLDYLDVMIAFFSVLTEDKIAKLDKKISELNEYIETEIKRSLTPRERRNLYRGWLNFNKSEEASKERSDCMEYLFNFRFLEEGVENGL